MRNNWAEIWQRKTTEAAEDVTLAAMLSLDGYDNFGGVSEADWIAHVARVAGMLQASPGDTVFEVGCGAGAFLYPWHMHGHPVAGIDYSQNLIAAARRAMPGGDFRVGDAAGIDNAEQFDLVVSQGVFLYFPSYEYAAQVLRKMAAKARKALAVLDVPDLAKQDAALAERRGRLGEEEYRRRYDGLDHLYFPQRWFEEVVAGTGARVIVDDSAIPGYFNSRHRFNVTIHLHPHALVTEP